jgi:RimJ/RimL family protein N-acetyltransferase
VAGRIRLRAYRESDVPDLLATWNDEQMRLWSKGPRDDAGARDWFESRNDWTDGEHASWAVTDDTDRLLGSVSLHHIAHEHAATQIGYWVSPWARGRGVATGAVRLAVSYAFTELGLVRVALYHAVENVASCRVAGASGFRLEGETRLSYRYADGELHDEHVHGVLAGEWNG